MATRRIVRTDRTRVWITDGSAGFARAPVYMDAMKAGAPRWPASEPTTQEAPDPDSLGSFVDIDSIPGAKQRAQVPLTNLFPAGFSLLHDIRERECELDVQVHIGTCEDPRDFNGGWASGKVLAWENGLVTEYSGSELGALQSSERASATEQATVSSPKQRQYLPMTFAVQAGTEITVEGIDVAVCDHPSCGGSCGTSSDGCQKVFVVTTNGGGSPAGPATVVFTADGGSTWASSSVDSMDSGDAPDAIACVGTNLVVASQASLSLHYAPIADIIAGIETWTEVTEGFDTNGPRDIFSLGSSLTWLVAAAGYIYFSEDITSGVEVQDAGNATVQNLNAIHGIDAENLVAVGASNAVVYTTNGGTSWNAVTGPAPGVALNTVVVKSAVEWGVGTANGKLYYTTDSGLTWTEKAFPGSGTAGSQVRDIAFSTPTVGYMVHDLTTPRARVLRTINGGFSWYLAPEGTASLPLMDRINAIAVCNNPNRVFGTGLADDGTDGVILKGSA